jgi:hypothetical protein
MWEDRFGAAIKIRFRKWSSGELRNPITLGFVVHDMR